MKFPPNPVRLLATGAKGASGRGGHCQKCARGGLRMTGGGDRWEGRKRASHFQFRMALRVESRQLGGKLPPIEESKTLKTKRGGGLDAASKECPKEWQPLFSNWRRFASAFASARSCRRTPRPHKRTPLRFRPQVQKRGAIRRSDRIVPIALNSHPFNSYVIGLKAKEAARKC